MEISSDLIGKAALVVVAGLMGAGSGFGGANFREAGHQDEVAKLERKLSAVESDMRLLRAQLSFYTTGTVDFSASVAAPMIYEMESVEEVLEADEAAPDTE